MFQYEPGNELFEKKIKYGIAKLLYGKYPPHSSLNYIWANKKQSVRFIQDPYSSRAMLIPVAAGQEKIGEWLEHRVNIVRVFRAAFGEHPPSMVTLAVMSDSDNTGESARAFIEYIRIYRE